MPAIIVNAYNRPHALARLLGSLQRAAVPADAPLIISMDHGGGEAVRRVAQDFHWRGGKRLIPRPARLGVVGHFLACGALTAEYGDIIYLEDDLYAGRQFYNFAAQALDFYRGDDRIAGISLNRLHFNGYTHHPFEPILDDADTFFLQVYWYQGQAYSAGMWQAFERWWASAGDVTPADGLHPLFLPHARWRDDFFPRAMKYLVQTGRYFVFPREAQATNFGDAGAHFNQPTPRFQVPLQNFRGQYRFRTLQQSAAVYDSFHEPLPDRLGLPPGFCDVDLNGTKPPTALRHGLVLTTRPTRNPLRTYGLALRPPEMNVLEVLPGEGIALARREDVARGWLADLRHAAKMDAYQRRRRASLVRAGLARLAGWAGWIGLAAAALLGLHRLSFLAAHTGGAPGWDYRVYTDALAQASAGMNPYEPFHIGSGYFNHPFLLAVIAPFNALGEAGYWVWTLASLAAWIAAIRLCWRLAPEGESASGWLILPQMLVFTPAVETLYMGQANMLAGLCVVLALRLGERGRAGWGGLALGAAMVLKTSPAVLLLYFLARREWRLAGAAALTVAGLTALSGWLFQPGIAGEYAAALARLAGSLHASPENASLPGVTGWAGMRWLGAGALAYLLWGAARGKRGETAQGRWAFSALLGWMLLFSPVTWQHHLVFLALPLVSLLAAGKGAGWLAFALIQADLVWQGMGAPFPAGALAGVLLLCGICAFKTTDTRRKQH
jgi:hypothetical protein